MKQVKIIVLFIVYTGTLISANPPGTLNRETRLRFAQVTPEIRNVDLFWSKLSIEQQLQLKKSGQKGLSDAQFQTTAKQYYYQTMPLYARIQLYTLEKWHALYRRLYPQKINPDTLKSPVQLSSSPQQEPESFTTPQEPPQASEQKPNFFIVNDVIKYHDGRTLPLSKSIIALIPLLDTMRNEFQATHKKKHFYLPTDYPTLKVFISSIERIAARLQEMTAQTRARYNIEKQYAPDDIPAHVRDIIKQELQNEELQKVSMSKNKYELFIMLADYMGATYWADEVACLWMQSTSTKEQWIEQTKNLPNDVLARYIKKYIGTYGQEGNYSTADLIFMGKFWGQVTYSEDGNYVIVYRAPITSLTGFEFLAGSEHIPKIKSLTINYTSRMDVKTIKPYTFLGLTNLQKLDLKRIGIEHIHNSAFATLTKLTELMLYENKIKELKKDMFMGLSALNYLSLDHNRITSIGEDIAKYLPQLKQLDLAANKLTAVDANVFSGNATLENVDLSYNDIKQVQPKAFAHMSALGLIKLSHNYSLTTLPGDIVEASNPNGEIHIIISKLQDRESLDKTLNKTRQPGKKVILETY